MSRDDKYIVQPGMEELVDRFYEMAFEEKDYQSPIYSNLKSIKKHFTDRQSHSFGGMKHIYTVKDQRTARIIAMAVLKKEGVLSQEEIEQFLREARITAAIEHPNIVPIYDIGLNREGKPFFTMKYLKGESLEQVVRELLKANPMYLSKYTLNILLEIYLKVCEAVAFAHSCGIVHLDIKPSNIMMGDHGQVYLCDWGLAKLIGSSEIDQGEIPLLDEDIYNDITLSGVVKGTPGFMAPEQIDPKFGDKNVQTDAYALGGLLYVILSLKIPYGELRGDDVLKATLEYPLTSPKEVASRDIPESLNAICMKAMSKEQLDRYESVDKLINDIRLYQKGFATHAEPVNTFKAVGMLLKRNKLFSAMTLLVFMTATVVSVVLGGKLKDTRADSMRELSHARSEKDRELNRLRKSAIKKISGLEKQVQLFENKLTSETERVKNLFASAESVRGLALKLKTGQGVECPDFSFSHGTLSFWFKPEKGKEVYPRLFQLGNCRWSLCNSNSGSRVFVSYKSTESIKEYLTGGALWGKWNHFTVTVSPTTDIIFYINRIKVDIATNYKGERGLAIGCWLEGDLERSLNSHFDEITVWDRVFSHKEVIALANRVLRGDEPNLKAYYKLDGNGNDATDNCNHLKLLGSPEFSP